MAGKNPVISFVVLSYNRIDVIEKNIDRLLAIEWPNKEIIIVDNCSTDGSRELIREKYASLPNVVYVETSINRGVCPGRNQGFRKTSGDYVICLDDDSVAPIDVCEKTIELFQQNPEVGCLAFSVYNMPDDVRPVNDFAGREFLGNYHGAGHAFRREALEKAGCLDEMFFFGGEEFDHTIAMYEAGFKTRYSPEVKVNHHVKKPRRNIFAKRASNWMASMNFVYIKWFPWPYAIWFILREWLALSFASIKRGVFSVMFIGPWLTMKGIPRVLKKRKVMSHATLAFYLNLDTKPNHCRIPFASFCSKYHARKAKLSKVQ